MTTEKTVARALRSYYRNETSYAELLAKLPPRAFDPHIKELLSYAKASPLSFRADEDWLDEHIERIFDIINLLDPPPPVIGNAQVLFYTEIDRRHKARSGTIYYRGPDNNVRRICGLAICKQDEGEYYLFGCDENWETITDTLHDTAEDAKDQAEFDYENAGATWRTLGKSTL